MRGNPSHLAATWDGFPLAIGPNDQSRRSEAGCDTSDNERFGSVTGTTYMQTEVVSPAMPRLVGAASLQVGFVHDYLTQFGGAERVLVALHELFPAAPIFCSIADSASLPEITSGWDVRESAIAKLPGATTYHRAMIPIYPAIFRRFEADLRDLDYLEPAALPPGVRHVMHAVFGGLRRSDRRAAERVDRFIANSRNVAAR